MTSQRNHYEVLGVPQGATTDQIKKKYRELARKYHPDVVQDKVLGQRVFSQINQAYRILSDSDRRAAYNQTLAAASGAAPNGMANGSGNGTATQTRPAAPGDAVKAQAIPGLLASADNAIMAGKPAEARAFCAKVLETDPRNVRALVIGGDALAQMGQREEAVAHYRRALAVAPSHAIQAQLTRLEQAPPLTRTAPTAPAAPADGAPPRNGAATKPAPPAAKPAAPAEKAGGLLGRFLSRK